MDKAESIIDQYIEKFGGFPSFLLMGMSDEELAEMMAESLRTGKPLKIETEKEADY